MASKELLATLQSLQAWRNQILGLGALPPDVQPIIDALSDGGRAAAEFDRAKIGYEARISELAQMELKWRGKDAEARADFDRRWGAEEEKLAAAHEQTVEAEKERDAVVADLAEKIATQDEVIRAKNEEAQAAKDKVDKFVNELKRLKSLE